MIIVKNVQVVPKPFEKIKDFSISKSQRKFVSFLSFSSRKKRRLFDEETCT